MSIIMLLTFAIIIGFIAFVVWYFGSQYRKDLKDIADISKHKKNKEKLLIDYFRVVGREKSEYNPQYYRKVMTWTTDEESQIYERGYLQAEKWMDDLRYAGVKIYVRLNHFYLPPEPSRISSSILYNVYSSRSVKNFISGMTKINFPTMDLKSLGVMIPIVIGLIVGMIYFLGMK